MGNAITTAGNNNLLGLFGLQDALMHMFPDFHNDVAKHLAVQSVVMPGKANQNNNRNRQNAEITQDISKDIK